MSGYVYVLALEKDNYYVGYTNNLAHRIHQHVQGVGARWTAMHRPMRVISVEKGTEQLEVATTALYMSLHGWKRVRGAHWCQVEKLNMPSFLHLHPNDRDRLAEGKEESSAENLV